jgi:hypothetical protein
MQFQVFKVFDVMHDFVTENRVCYSLFDGLEEWSWSPECLQVANITMKGAP